MSPELCGQVEQAITAKWAEDKGIPVTAVNPAASLGVRNCRAGTAELKLNVLEGAGTSRRGSLWMRSSFYLRCFEVVNSFLVESRGWPVARVSLSVSVFAGQDSEARIFFHGPLVARSAI